jgi:hypothetical protein
MEMALAIIGLIGALIPVGWKIYDHFYSKKAKMKKRRELEEKAAQELRERATEAQRVDSEAHRKQDEAETRWNAEQRRKN